MPLSDESIRRAVLDRDDPAAWAVLADHLQSRGDIRGELWALEEALADAFGERELTLVQRRNRLLGVNAGEWLGPLVAHLDRDTSPPGGYRDDIAALRAGRKNWSQLRHLPRLFRRQEPSIQLQWRAGFTTAARLRGTTTAAAMLLEKLLSCPASALLRCLDVDVLDDSLGQLLADGASGIQRADRLATVRALRIRTGVGHMWPAAWLSAAAPHVQTLALGNADLSGATYPHVSTLRLAGNRADTLLAGLGRAHFPDLEHLHLGHCESIAEDGGDLAEFLSGHATPALRTLRLARLPALVETPLLRALRAAPLWAQLQRLELEWLNDRPDTQLWLDEHPSALTHLKVSAIREYAEPFCPGL